MGGSHKHRWRESIWSLEGPIAVYIECQVCVRGHWLRPRKLLRAAPEGMAQDRFEAYMDLIRDKDHAPELIEALRDRLRSATDRQRGDAWQKGILLPLPTWENLDDYRERNAQRMELKQAA